MSVVTQVLANDPISALGLVERDFYEFNSRRSLGTYRTTASTGFTTSGDTRATFGTTVMSHRSVGGLTSAVRFL